MLALLPFSVGPWELLLVLFIVLLIVGPGKLTGVGKSLGKAIGEFRQAQNSELEERKPAESGTDLKEKNK